MILEIVRYMLLRSGAPTYLWEYAVTLAALVVNSTCDERVQALTPLHGRRRALAAALYNAQAQEGPLLLAALRRAASGQRRTRRTHAWRAQPAARRRQAE